MNQNRRSVMGLTIHLSCVYNAFSSCRVSFSLIYLNWCHSTKLDFFDESYNDGSGSVSPGKFVGSSGDVGSGFFVPSGIESIGNVFPLVIFVPRGVESKVGQPIVI